ncbi:SigE family RNA polymerase sigma factor [Cellulomonas shaoxiangyii]|uniref:SigE family RNA polymerase sigma factor n=2 Tax=Cellulomonas shaoxiangyii TaxID=2566013 RepID=A0A4P7SMT1_9CELL|nr:SigE family RNA polymerase sigma factor [Cellulomonas shaoxiangyii]TGY84987.1 SigE family RNA polymerase sigma factor [Cellulomonas shaoxiangyii]
MRPAGPDSAAIPLVGAGRVRERGAAGTHPGTHPGPPDHHPPDHGASARGVPDAVATGPAPLTRVAARALDDVVRDHLPGLLRYATVLTGDGHTAADLVQEVLLRAHLRWTRISLMERPDLYLRRMVTNEHLSWRRRWHVRTIHPAADDVLATHADPHADHADDVVHDDAMWQHLAALPPRQRAVLVLRYYEGLSDPEIATVLGTSSATVRSHASRALAALRQTDLTTPPEHR